MYSVSSLGHYKGESISFRQGVTECKCVLLGIQFSFCLVSKVLVITNCIVNTIRSRSDNRSRLRVAANHRATSGRAYQRDQ